VLDSVSDVRELSGMVRFFPGLCLVGLGLSLSAPSFAASPLIAVTESPANTAPRALRLEIRPTVEAALKERGAAVVPRAKIAGSLANCTGDACAVRIGAATGATHVLVIDSSYLDDGYKMRLQVFDGRTGRELYSDGQVCEVCTHDDFTKALRERTAILWSRIQTEETLPQRAPVTKPIAAPVAVRPLLPAASVPAEPAASASLVRRLVGPVLVVAGVAATVTGAVYVAKNGDAATNHAGCGGTEPCPFTRRTMAWSAPMVGVGLVAAIVGGYLWWTTPSGTAVTASVGPDGLSVFGAF
jgi:hypothetical protein